MHVSTGKVNRFIYLNMAILGAYLSVYQNALPHIKTEFQLNGLMTGVIISLHFIGSFIFPAILGELSQHIGKNKVTVVSFSFLLIGLIMIIAAKSLFSLGLGIFFTGGGFAAIEGTLSAMIIEKNPDNSNKPMNLSQMYFCCGAAIGPFLWLPLTAVSSNWRAPYFPIILLFLLLIISFRFVSGGQIQNNTAYKKSEGLYINKLLLKPAFLAFLLVMLLYVSVEEGAVFWVSDLALQTMGTTAFVSWFISVYWTGMAAGRFITSKSERPSVGFMLTGMVISTLFFAGTLIFKNFFMIFICYLMIGFGFAAVWPLLIVGTAERFSEAPDTAIGAMMSSAAVGGAGMPAVLGIVTQQFGAKISFSAMLFAVICVTLLLFYLFNRDCKRIFKK